MPDRIVRHEVHTFTSRTDRCLAKSISKDRSFTINFCHAVYRMLFGSNLVLNKNDFCNTYFMDGWDYNYRKIGSSSTYRGRRIQYLIRCTLHMIKDIDNRYVKNSKGEYVPKSKGFREAIQVTLAKVNF